MFQNLLNQCKQRVVDYQVGSKRITMSVDVVCLDGYANVFGMGLVYSKLQRSDFFVSL